jgi:hypothetical protein
MGHSMDRRVKLEMREYSDNDKEIRLDENHLKDPSKDIPPPSEISTSRKHSVDYFTKDGFILRTGYTDLRDWYLLPVRECLDNSVDFLWKYYRGNNTSVEVDIYKNNQLFCIQIRNSNPMNIPVFEDLEAVFDYNMRYGSKQDVHTITRGMLGDATKQILSLGYILMHINDVGTEFKDKQWEYPLIIRHNGKEHKIYLHYDKANQEPRIRFEISTIFENHAFTDTEIDVVLPIIDQVRNILDRYFIEKFCREYSILTTDISFKFSIIDESTEGDHFSASSFQNVLTGHPRAPPRDIVSIQVPALYPIPTFKEWNNSDSIYSYTPTEFTSRITNVHDKQNTIIYDVLKSFREGTNIKKDSKTEKSVASLVSNPDRYTEIEDLYKELKNALSPQKKLSIPYTTNRKDRVKALVPRIAELYRIDNTMEPSYRIEWGYYDDGLVKYPYAFEILGISLTNPKENETKFIGAINYSISPNNIKFEGEYHINGNVDKNAEELLIRFGFHKHSAKKSRLPCIVIGNLITSRREPQGYDKSRIDMKPFAQTIITAIEKMASHIPTLRSAGYIIRPIDEDYRNARRKKINRKVSAKELLRQFLIKERGLPDV